MKSLYWYFFTLILIGASIFLLKYTSQQPILPKGQQVDYAYQIYDEEAIDQDDLCIWIHPQNAKESLIISADKGADKIFVYNTAGETLQKIDITCPGNIDIRYNFPFQGKPTDIVVTTTRGKENKIIVFAILVEKRNLVRIDDNSTVIDTDNRSDSRKSFGGALYHSQKTNKYYFLTTDENGDKATQQHEIYDNGKGQVSLKKVKEWNIGYKCEGAVADDENGFFYICQERTGIWKLSAEPDGKTPGEMIRIDQNANEVRFEGIAIYKTSRNEGYIVVSRQHCDSYDMYKREDNNDYIGSFYIKDVSSTDGLDITNVPVSDQFPGGVFVCHSNTIVKNGKQRPLVIVNWQRIASIYSLQMTSSYNVRE